MADFYAAHWRDFAPPLTIDGTEPQPHWVGVLRNSWIEDIAKAVAFVMGRRTVITQRDELWR
ncbi:hypothetical protein [Sphingomonas fennica]|uniref:hypothetical protein n=1 Tax=Edaphosphingomonas fennica TaxID=114404 RepID=UPI0011B1DD96|nr:hypothetical protein [Sphingomonas fennica]